MSGGLDLQRPRPEMFLNRRTLIRGEVNRGKTTLLGRIMRAFWEQGYRDLGLIDLAPPLTRGVGGKMELGEMSPAFYYPVSTVAPRLSGSDEAEVEALARRNRAVIDQALEQYLKAPAQVLFINDLSLYLHQGRAEELISWLKNLSTVVMNGYYGQSLGGGELGRRERRGMEALARWCHQVIEL